MDGEEWNWSGSSKKAAEMAKGKNQGRMKKLELPISNKKAVKNKMRAYFRSVTKRGALLNGGSFGLGTDCSIFLEDAGMVVNESNRCWMFQVMTEPKMRAALRNHESSVMMTVMMGRGSSPPQPPHPVSELSVAPGPSKRMSRSLVFIADRNNGSRKSAAAAANEEEREEARRENWEMLKVVNENLERARKELEERTKAKERAKEIREKLVKANAEAKATQQPPDNCQEGGGGVAGKERLPDETADDTSSASR